MQYDNNNVSIALRVSGWRQQKDATYMRNVSVPVLCTTLTPSLWSSKVGKTAARKDGGRASSTIALPKKRDSRWAASGLSSCRSYRYLLSISICCIFWVLCGWIYVHIHKCLYNCFMYSGSKHEVTTWGVLFFHLLNAQPVTILKKIKK